jgi:hypothetical protein
MAGDRWPMLRWPLLRWPLAEGRKKIEDGQKKRPLVSGRRSGQDTNGLFFSQPPRAFFGHRPSFPSAIGHRNIDHRSPAIDY